MDIREYLKNKIQLSEEIFDIVSKSSKLINSKDSEILDSKKYLDSRILSFYQQKYKFVYFLTTDFYSVYFEVPVFHMFLMPQKDLLHQTIRLQPMLVLVCFLKRS